MIGLLCRMLPPPWEPESETRHLFLYTVGTQDPYKAAWDTLAEALGFPSRLDWEPRVMHVGDDGNIFRGTDDVESEICTITRNDKGVSQSLSLKFSVYISDFEEYWTVEFEQPGDLRALEQIFQRRKIDHLLSIDMGVLSAIEGEHEKKIASYAAALKNTLCALGPLNDDIWNLDWTNLPRWPVGHALLHLLNLWASSRTPETIDIPFLSWVMKGRVANVLSELVKDEKISIDIIKNRISRELQKEFKEPRRMVGLGGPNPEYLMFEKTRISLQNEWNLALWFCEPSHQAKIDVGFHRIDSSVFLGQ